MPEAIIFVREKKILYLKAAQHFQVPRSTLFRLCQKDEQSRSGCSYYIRRKTILGSELERQLVEYIFMMESKFLGLTRSDIRRMAHMLAKRII